jgi:N-acetylneuraminate synthase
VTRTFVIAEIGSCHDGSLDKAYRLVEAAKDCGANAAKFQYWSSAERLAERRNAAEYLPIYLKYQMPRDWLEKLKKRCDSVGVEFMCTSYLPEDIATVEPYVKRFKIASFESGDSEFVLAHLPFHKEIIASVSGGGPMPVTGKRLLCVSAYPCPLDQLELSRILQWDERGSDYDGLSDHTTSVLTGALAVAAGAEIVEKHVRLVRTDDRNPDYEHSLPCDEDVFVFHDYVENIREAEKAMGDGKKGPMPCEEAMLKYKVRNG